MNLRDADYIAKAFVETLAPACQRIEIAGSIRRRRPEVNDIDIVLIPHYSTVRDGMFDEKRVSMLDGVMDVLEADGRITQFNRGEKLKRGVFPRKGDFAWDIFVATPETWSTLLLIRTGSKEHNIMLCQRAQDMRMKLHADGSGVRDASGALIRCFESEADVLRLLGLEYVEPSKREIA